MLSVHQISTIPPNVETNEGEPIAKKGKVQDDNTQFLSATSSRADKYYAPVQEATIPEELLSFLKSAFTNQLSKEVWTNVMEQYPDIKGTAEFLVSPVMQTGMKDDIKRVHGFTKTKDVFTFDDGLADKQAPFISAVRPLVCALQSLEMVGGVDDGEEIPGPDPDHIKALIEDAIVLLGNAHCRLNSWRQRRFAKFLTDVGKRTLKDQIPADKHLFPEQFHNVIREEHDDANTNRKVVAHPVSAQKRFFLANGVSFSRITPFGTSYTVVQPSSANKKLTPSAKIQTIDPVGLDEGVTQNTREADYQLPKLNKIKPPDNLVAG